MATQTIIARLIMGAYSLKEYQLQSWLGKNYNLPYDIAAIADGNEPLTREALRPMLRNILIDRFGLRFHRETREVAAYVLVVGKKPFELKESTAEDAYGASGRTGDRSINITFGHTTMENLATKLAREVNVLVVDRTGFDGSYSFKLNYTPQSIIDKEPDVSDVTVFSALQDRLGLKLEPQKVPVEMFIIDNIGAPSAN